EHPRDLGRDGERVDEAAERPPERDVQTRDRGDHLERVAVSHDDVRVRVRREERAEPWKVRRRLQQPAVAAVAPLQMLEEAMVIAVRGPEILLVEPALVRRDEPARRELEAQERVAEYDHALLRQAGADRMDLPELRRQPEEPADVARRARDPRLRVVRGAVGWRRGITELPVERNTGRGVLGEEAGEEGRARAGQPGDGG